MIPINNKIKIIDFFAGIGGIKLGFELASKNNIECIFINEWNKYSEQTYLANYPNEKIHKRTLFLDMKRILIAKKAQMLLLENVMQLKGYDKGKTLATIIEHLRAIGYENMQYEVLKTKKFRLSQNRERIYIV